jgi:hypothetical protein
MPLGINDGLEIIQIQEHHGKLAAVVQDFLDGLIELGGQVAGIVKARDLMAT